VKVVVDVAVDMTWNWTQTPTGTYRLKVSRLVEGVACFFF
jgi:hypothetical protein